MSSKSFFVLMMTASITICRSVHADIVCTFDSNDQGWTVVSFGNLSNDDYSIVGTYTPVHNLTGGNPGGYISISDPDGGEFTFSAPAAYLGNQASAIGLSYDLTHPVGEINYQTPDVMLFGNGTRLLWKSNPDLVPGEGWTSVNVLFAPSSNWRVGTTTGALATVADFQAVLGDLTGIFIRGEYTYGNEIAGVDNVRLHVLAADTTPPTITGVFFDGSAWDPAFRAAAGSPNFGYPAQTGAGQLTPLPWSNLNTIYVQFSEPVNPVNAAQVGVRGINVPVYTVSSVTMIGTTVAKISLSANFATDRIILDLDGSSGAAITDLSGNKLAGAWTEQVSTFPTNGTAGNDFLYRFVLGVGDADRNSQVRNNDVNVVRGNLFNDVTSATFNIFADINGDGLVRNSDLNAVRNSLFNDPPPGPGPF